MFDEHAQRQAQAAVSKATDDLVMRKYLMDRRPKEQKYVEKPTVYLKSRSDAAARDDDDDDEDEESDPDFAEDDEVLAELRARRMEELKSQLSQSSHDSHIESGKLKKPKHHQQSHGSYDEVGENDFLGEVTENEYVVCAFYHKDFFTCRVVDKHLNIMAQHHKETRFIKMNAEKAPFFVNKLAVKMLPTIVCFVDGIAVDRVVGFDEIGGKEDFATHVLAARLAKSGVIVGKGGKRASKKAKRTKVIA